MAVQPGERLCLVGRNGAGKSTLLRIVAGEVEADRGTVRFSDDARCAYLGQEVPRGLMGTTGALVAHDDHGVEESAAGEFERMLTRLGVAPDAPLDTLSGGALRRVLLARALATGAQVLLLDEPTNHLDIDSVIWLEDFLLRLSTTRAVAVIFVTHDRAFARRLAQRVLEVDRGTLFRHDCNFDEFIRRRDRRLEEEEAQRVAADKVRAQEEAWLRRGVKARRTRDEGRVRRLLAMRDAYRQRRSRAGSARMEIGQAERSGDLVITSKGLSFRWSPEAEPLFQELELEILRGDRVGVVGPNGSGKTTLIRVILGDLTATAGEVRRGANVQHVLFDQLRDALDPQKTVRENLGEGYDTLTINGRNRHISAYMQDFLFAPEDANKPVYTLSGGERNRLLLAKLFARPSNLLVLDEPTNDLDAETLELLEDQLLEYHGTIILVSHDRQFLDNVVTDCLVFTGDGSVQEYAGGYSDWRALAQTGGAPAERTAPQPSSATTPSRPRRERRGLTYRQQQELRELPDRIAALEDELHTVETQLADPEVYRGGGTATPAELTARLSELQDEVARAYARWEELEALEEPGDAESSSR